MPMTEAFKLVVLERYAQFEGRAGRAEYWWYALANFLLLFVLSLFTRVAGIFFIVYLVAAIGLIIPSLAVAVRRLHDTGRSGWWLLIGIFPLVGFIVLIVFLVQEGTPGSNEYGITAAGP